VPFHKLWRCDCLTAVTLYPTQMPALDMMQVVVLRVTLHNTESEMNIFLTYSDTGKSFSERLITQIEKHGFTVTPYLHNGIPTNERDEVQAQVATADCVIVIESPYIGYAYPDSHPLQIARQLGKPTIPVIYEPDPDIAIELSKTPSEIRTLYSRSVDTPIKIPDFAGLPVLSIRYDDENASTNILDAIRQVAGLASAWKSENYDALVGSRWHIIPLLRVLYHDNKENRLSAGKVLAQSSELIDLYASKLFDRHVGARHHSAYVLGNMIPNSLSAMLDALQDPTRKMLIWPMPARHESIGLVICQALEKADPPNMESLLWEYARSHHSVRSHAAKYILLRRQFHVIEKEENRHPSLYDPDDRETALRQINHLMSLLNPELLDIDVLLDLFSDPTYGQTPVYAAMTLCAIGDSSILIRLLQTNYHFSSNVTQFRNFAMRHLADPSIVPELITLINGDGFYSYGIVGLLEYIGTPEAITAVENWFMQKSPEQVKHVRESMRWSLDGNWK